MAKKRSHAPSPALKRQIKSEINKMHKATAEFVHLCMDIAKTRPKGMKRIEKSVSRITDNMARLDRIYKKHLK